MGYLLPSLHDLCAHLKQAGLGLAFRERDNGVAGFIDVVLGHGACLLNAVALDDEVACLGEIEGQQVMVYRG